jgi:hypothetical protein
MSSIIFVSSFDGSLISVQSISHSNSSSKLLFPRRTKWKKEEQKKKLLFPLPSTSILGTNHFKLLIRRCKKKIIGYELYGKEERG